MPDPQTQLTPSQWSAVAQWLSGFPGGLPTKWSMFFRTLAAYAAVIVTYQTWMAPPVVPVPPPVVQPVPEPPTSPVNAVPEPKVTPVTPAVDVQPEKPEAFPEVLAENARLRQQLADRMAADEAERARQNAVYVEYEARREKRNAEILANNARIEAARTVPASTAKVAAEPTKSSVAPIQPFVQYAAPSNCPGGVCPPQRRR